MTQHTDAAQRSARAWAPAIPTWKAGFGCGCLFATAIVNALWLIILELGWLS